MPVTPELSPADTLGILAQPGVSVERTSGGLGWPRMYLSVQQEQPYAARFDGVANHVVILHLDGPVEVSRGSGPARETRRIVAGGLFVHPAGRELDVSLGGRLRTLHVYLDAPMVDEAVGRRVELAEEIGTQDPLLEQLLLALDVASRSYTDRSRLYVDTLGAAVAAQLAERHAHAGRTRRPDPAGGLGDRDLTTVTDLMREHLQDGVSLAELASAVGLSEGQLARSFKTRTGQPPHRYLVGLRLDQARRLLTGTDLPIATVALDCGFAGQEHLTRSMRRRWDVTPGALRLAAR